jgi:hypothetical protein
MDLKNLSKLELQNIVHQANERIKEINNENNVESILAKLKQNGIWNKIRSRWLKNTEYLKKIGEKKFQRKIILEVELTAKTYDLDIFNEYIDDYDIELSGKVKSKDLTRSQAREFEGYLQSCLDDSCEDKIYLFPELKDIPKFNKEMNEIRQLCRENSLSFQTFIAEMFKEFGDE